MPGIGPLLGAEFLAAIGGDMTWFATADRLAGFAGLAPAPWDSGRIRGNLHRPRRCQRGKDWIGDRPSGRSTGKYKQRHAAERGINRLMRNRAVAIRYDKFAVSYQATLHITAINEWIRSHSSDTPRVDDDRVGAGRWVHGQHPLSRGRP